MLHRPVTQQFKWFQFNSSLIKVLSLRYFSEDFNSLKFHPPRQRIPSTPTIQSELVRTPSEYIKGSRVIQVAILGVPNAGKSTLVNQLSGWNTCSVSKKVHTTRKTSKTVLIKDETQIVFLDTPGLVAPSEAKQHNLETSFLIDPERALAQANLLLVLHDVSNKWTRGSLSPKILRLLHLYPDKESILVLNKIDCLKEKRLLLALTNKLSEGIIGGKSVASNVDSMQERVSKQTIDNSLRTQSSSELKEKELGQFQQISEREVMKKIEGKVGWPYFSNVFMISAIDGDGVLDIAEHLYQAAQPGRWIYNSSVVTDQNPHEMVIACLRGKLLDMLEKELPYSVKISVRFWEVDVSGTLNIVLALDCRKRFTARVVVGTGGRNVIQLARETEQDLRNMFRQEVKLRLVVEPDV